MELGLKAQGRKLGATLSCYSIHKPEAGPVAIGRMIKRKKKKWRSGSVPWEGRGASRFRETQAERSQACHLVAVG